MLQSKFILDNSSSAFASNKTAMTNFDNTFSPVHISFNLAAQRSHYTPLKTYSALSGPAASNLSLSHFHAHSPESS